MTTTFDDEPIPGLPGLLPAGERVLWRGRPSWLGLAKRAFLGWPVAAYFAALMIWRVVEGTAEGIGFEIALVHAAWLFPVMATGLAVIAALAWATARATVYTITNRRVVMRFGVAMTLAINIPFKRVVSAGMRSFDDGTGDVSLRLTEGDKFAWAMLWPNVRPWRMANTEPTLRALREPEAAAEALAEALATYAAEHGIASTATAPEQPAAAPAGVAIPAE